MIDSDELTPLQKWAGVSSSNSRTTLTVVFTDIVNSTSLTKSLGDSLMFDLLIEHFTAARTLNRLFGGFEIKLIGDAYMAAFRTADAALEFATEFSVDTGSPHISIRAGIHIGQVRILENDIYGLMVNYASRLSHVHVLGGEGVFVSASVKALLDAEYGTEHSQFRVIGLDPTSLKGFGQNEHVYRIVTKAMREAALERRKLKKDQSRPV